MGLIDFIKPTPLTFIGRELIVADIYSYTFETDKELTWLAGQHGLLELALPNGKTSRRMFSISSAPSESKVTVTTHWLGDQASHYKRALWSLEPGDKAKLRGPVGPMYIRDYSAHNVLIAGGIGITPFHSILKEADLNNHQLKATLLYANRSLEKIPFKTELDDLAARLPGLNINYVVSPEKISEHSLRQASKDISNSMYYLSGPPKMIASYRKLLKSIGVSSRQIKSDPFIGY